jgi:chaperonin GroES
MPVAPGDHVVFPGSAGVWVDVEEERLLVCRVGQLLGVLEEVEGPRGSDPSTGRAGPAAID